jgi:dGTPase
LIKYPWAYGENRDKPKKWGYYKDEQEYFEWARAGCIPHQKTLTAELMDWADDITYAIHDLLDFYRAGLIPLELVRKSDDMPASIERAQFLARMFARRPEWSARRGEYEAALDSIIDGLPFDMSHRYSGAEAEEQTLYQFATTLISGTSTRLYLHRRNRQRWSTSRRMRAIKSMYSKNWCGST